MGTAGPNLANLETIVAGRTSTVVGKRSRKGVIGAQLSALWLAGRAGLRDFGNRKGDKNTKW